MTVAAEEAQDPTLPLARALGQVPSVTRILAAMGLGPDYDGVPTGVLERKRRLGQALHAAIQYDVEGTLDEASIHPDIAAPFAAYRAVRASGFRVERAEVELLDVEWRVIGHPDALGADPNGAPALLDWKAVYSLDQDAVAYQLAAYRWLARRSGQGERVTYAIQFTRDGTYRVHRMDTRIADLNAEQIFLAAVLLWHARARKNRRSA